MDVSNSGKLDAGSDQNISFVYADNSGPEEIKRKLSEDHDDSGGSHGDKHRKKRKKVKYFCVFNRKG
jgi:hypothetical protein